MAVGKANFRCRVGHERSAEALVHARDDEVDNALWKALRSLQEKSKLSRRLAANVAHNVLFERYTQLADEAGHAAAVLGERLVRPDMGTEDVGA
jgi:two-component system chemotaxis response regulator CheB